MDKLLQERTATFLKACNHEETEYIPNLLFASNSILSYADTNYWEIENDNDKLFKVIDKFVSEMHCDVGDILIQGTPHTHKALGERTETFLSPDDVSLMHIQLQKMQEDEYPQLIEDVDKFVKEVLIPRKYPSLFNGDRKAAVDSLKTVIEEQVSGSFFGGRNTIIRQKLQDDYSIPPFIDFRLFFAQPIDMIFDYFRGFVGTISDIRRRPELVLEACDMLYEKKCNHFETVPGQFPFAVDMPHIPAYLNPKQFEKFYWPWMKESFTNVSKGGNKVVMSLEGRWAHILDFFLDLPKDSCFIMVDDDEIFEINKRIGHHQVITGGVKLSKILLESKEANMDYAKRVIDECAPGGGFIFNADKIPVCKGDINQILIDVYNMAHEYGKSRGL